jgi:SAM-dependent methyltransferase
MKKHYLNLREYYESKLKLYGPTHKGLAWSDKKSVNLRYDIMLDILRFAKKSKSSILDLGCGYGGILERIAFRKYKVNYTGYDISNLMIQSARQLFPKNIFYKKNILEDKINKKFDFVIMNGLFTVKNTLKFREMENFFIQMITKVNQISKCGFAFNLMSKDVSWRRKDLFYYDYNKLSELLTKKISRNFIFRYDYKLFEYTTYVFK